MATVRFSVVIPTYNRATYLRRCLDSLIAQVYKNFEVIVCDDGSTDNSEEMVKGVANRLDIQYCWSEHWGGPARPRNIGIEKAMSEWVCFLDSDDWWYPEKLDTCLPYLANHDVIFHSLEVVSAQGPTGRLIGRDLESPVFVDLLTNLNAVPNSAAITRRDLLRRVGGISEDKGFIAAEDFDLWIRVSERTERFYRIPRTLGAYLDIGTGHNLSASAEQIRRELCVFERYRHRLSDSQAREGYRNWNLRHAPMTVTPPR